MRDVLLTLFILGAIPASFKRPVVGLMVFSLLAYMRIQDLTWGFARFERWSFYVAIVMLAGFTAQKEKQYPPFDLRVGLLIFMPVWVCLGLLFAEGERAVDIGPVVEYIKIIFIAIFTTMVVKRREHLRALVWVIALSFAFYGAKNGIATLLSGGSLYIIRGPGGMLEDNNDFALAMAMAIPLMVGIATSERRKLFRRWMWAFVPLTGLSIVATRSRGGALSMAMALAILTWRSRNRVAGFAIGALALVAGLSLAPAEYYERLSTIRNFEEDGSAMGRIRAWKVAGRMIQANPMFGVGFERFQLNYLDYEPNPTPNQLDGDGTRVAHNGYLQIWSETGTPVFLAYVTLMLLSLVDIWRIRFQARKRYERSWILSYCTMFEATLLTFMMGSMFLNRAHFDLIYHYFAIVLVFGRIARAEMEAPQRRTATERGMLGAPLERVAKKGFGRRPRGARGFRNTTLVPGAR